MRGAAEGRHLGLELGYLRAHDELAVGEHALHALLDAPPQAPALGLKVDEGDRPDDDGRLGHVVHGARPMAGFDVYSLIIPVT